MQVLGMAECEWMGDESRLDNNTAAILHGGFSTGQFLL